MSNKTRRISAIFLMAIMLAANANVAFAADVDSEATERIVKSEIITSNGNMIQGEIKPMWLAYGPITRYPSEGGTWEYGFWNAKVRSYYTVNRCHGSTVKLNGNQSRSIDTAAGKKSYAEIWTVQHDGTDRYYYRVCD